MANKGEWSEPYAAIRILGDGKLYIADANGNRNPLEWMSILELIRHETRDRIVAYRYDENNVDIDTENVILAANQLKYNGLMEGIKSEFANLNAVTKSS